MSTPTTDPKEIPTAVAVVLEAYAEAIRSPIELAVIMTTFASILIPILVALLWFSTSSLRRQPVFSLNVISIVLGISVAVLGLYDGLYPILHPTKPADYTASSVFVIIFLLAPWVTEMVLVFRLTAVFPPHRTSPQKLAAVFAFPIAVKCVRLVCCVYLCRTWFRDTQTTRNLDGTLIGGGIFKNWKDIPWLVAELFLQIFDNAYLSIIFIWKLHNGRIFNAGGSQRISLGGSGSLTSKLRALFWIAVGNFVLPVMMNVATIIDVFVDTHYILRISNLLLTNYYVSIIGVVFATVWTSGMATKQHEPHTALVPVRRVDGLPQATTLESVVSAGGASESRVFAQALGKTQTWPDSESSGSGEL
ncbi:hypothetical protein PsYK624_138890 [Phanerochaete sordida]|uniref:Uncharacterized protein n=1 Tax=Phanerochaete sordida TaxID=48140 RepID=A0A9P3GKQ4_9APHY|nr:hypothetical protein PsYK624_138890 [Phanerochaete sordida]